MTAPNPDAQDGFSFSTVLTMVRPVHILLAIVAVMLTLATDAPPRPYPVDGYALTGIRRLERVRLIAEGEIPGTKLSPGAMKSISEIRLNLAPPLASQPASGTDDFPQPDPELQRAIEALFQGRDRSYSIALLDITPGKPRRFVSVRSKDRYAPGSVGKLAIAAGLFTELARIFPKDLEARRELLKTRIVTAGPWCRTNSHSIPIFDPETRQYESRIVRETDVFSLFEWADHMVSASSNAAASIVWKEVILMRAFGANYPPGPAEETAFFESTSKAQLQELSLSVVNDPLRAIGIPAEDWQLGTLFTGYGQRMIPGAPSYGNPEALLRYLLRVEEGRIVDAWSSLEIKRLMYMTARRIRYAYSPALSTAALYFKSGSLYRCKPEPDFTCLQYHGNVDNYMNSVVTVETADGRIYLVALMSNVLRVNSADEHQRIASAVEGVMVR